jgi:hypothetical protein
MAVDANLYDTGLAAGQIFENITQAAQFTFNENAMLRQLVTMYNMVGTPGLTASIPVYPRVTGLSALAAGADLTTNADTDATAVDITAAEYAVMQTIQDIVLESSPLAVAQDTGVVLGQAIAQAMDELIVDLFTNATTEVGPGVGNEVTVETILKAAARLRANSVPMTGIVAVLSPSQAFNIKKTLLNAGGTLGNNDLANLAAREYFVGRIAGIDIYESASIDIDNNDDAVGAVFHPAAIGMVMKRDLRIATERDESLRGFEIVASSAFGAGILDQNKIVKITSDSAL